MKSQLTEISKLYSKSPRKDVNLTGTGFSTARGGKKLRSVEEDTPARDEVILLDEGETIK